MKIKTVFLDIDGVLNVGQPWFMHHAGAKIDPLNIDGCCSTHEVDMVEATNARRLTQGWSELSKAEFWSSFSFNEFWEEFPLSPEFDSILSFAKELVGWSNTYILSSTTLCPFSGSGKMLWMKKHLPREMQRNYLLGAPKWLCAKRDALLIDDMDKNIDKFRNFGGVGLLVPRPWNSNYKRVTQPYLDQCFRNLIRDNQN